MYEEKIDFDKIDITKEPPTKEPARQYYYMAKCREYVKKLGEKLGRRPVCCVKTFGCPVV